MSKFTDEQLDAIVKLIQEAYEKAGKKIKTLELSQGNDENVRLLIDNRKPEDIN